jgi:hypothetical protein
MNKNIIMLGSYVIVSVGWLYFLARLPIFPSCEGLACAGNTVIILFVQFIVIPIVFAIIGFIFSKDGPAKHALYSFGISLGVSILVFLPQYFLARNEMKRNAEQNAREMRINYEANPEQYKSRPY